MARLEYFVVAESVSVDQTTNLTSVFNISEMVVAEKFPVVLKCAAVSLWHIALEDDGKDWQVTLKVTPPGEETKSFTTNFSVRSEKLRHRVIQRIEFLPVKEAGNLLFEILLNGEHAADHIVTVQKKADT